MNHDFRDKKDKCGNSKFITNEGLYQHFLANEKRCYLHFLMRKYMDVIYKANELFRGTKTKKNQRASTTGQRKKSENNVPSIINQLLFSANLTR